MKRFVIIYLTGSFVYNSPNGRSLPVMAFDKESAVVKVLGGPAESWNGDVFSMWSGKLTAKVEAA